MNITSIKPFTYTNFTLTNTQTGSNICCSYRYLYRVGVEPAICDAEVNSLVTTPNGSYAAVVNMKKCPYKQWSPNKYSRVRIYGTIYSVHQLFSLQFKAFLRCYTTTFYIPILTPRVLQTEYLCLKYMYIPSNSTDDIVQSTVKSRALAE